MEVAFERGKPYSLDMKDPMGPVARRDELPNTLSGLNDKNIEKAFKMALMHGEVGYAGQNGKKLGHMIPREAA